MKQDDSMVMGDDLYHILKRESDLFRPEYFGISPTWSDDPNFFCNGLYELKEFQLYLKNIMVSSDRSYPVINGIKPEPYLSETDRETVQYLNVNEPLNFTGAIIIANQFVKNYCKNDAPACFSYKQVKELIFQEGKLVTTIDHSKAMLRIRKNLDMGLRNLDKKRDVICISKFLKASFAGYYPEDDTGFKYMFKTIIHKNRNIPD